MIKCSYSLFMCVFYVWMSEMYPVGSLYGEAPARWWSVWRSIVFILNERQESTCVRTTLSFTECRAVLRWWHKNDHITSECFRYKNIRRMLRDSIRTITLDMTRLRRQVWSVNTVWQSLCFLFTFYVWLHRNKKKQSLYSVFYVLLYFTYMRLAARTLNWLLFLELSGKT